MSYTEILYASYFIGASIWAFVFWLNWKAAIKKGFENQLLKKITIFEPLMYGVLMGYGAYIVLGAYFFNMSL